MPDIHSASIRPARVSLSILATTDVHAHLLPFDYFTNKPDNSSNLSKLATLIKEIRAITQNTLLLDNGDFLQGTPITDLYETDTVPRGLENPAVTAMNHLQYDAAALGNHEFNLPIPLLGSVLSQASFPIICSNIHGISSEATGIWENRTILERSMVDQLGNTHRIKIGLFGVMPPQVLLWDRSRVEGHLASDDIVIAATKAVSQLRKDGADIVIGLGHTGVSNAAPSPNMEHAGIPLAAVEGLDALVLGHSHLVLPGPQPEHPAIDQTAGTIHGTPTVMPGSAASHLGRIDVTLERSDIGWALVEHTTTAIPASRRACKGTPHLVPETDPDFLSILTPAHEWALSEIRKHVGTLRAPLHSYFGLLPEDPTVRFVAQAQLDFVSRHFENSDYAHLPVLSATAPQKCGARGGPTHYTDIPAGQVAMYHISDLQFFPNDISALLMTGAEIADWLEMSASQYCQIAPNQADQPLRNDHFAGYNCDTILGLTYQIDLTQPARYAPSGEVIAPEAQRIKGLSWRGEPLSATQSVILAVNNYRSGGGGYFPHVSPEKVILESKTKIRDILIDFLRQTDGNAQNTLPIWSFVPIAGASVTIDTSPKAVTLLHTAPHLRLEELGPTQDGFTRFRLDLSN